MKPTTVTTVFILLYIAAPFAWNAFGDALGWQNASVSEVVTYWGHRHPILIMALGILVGAVLGHWWPIHTDVTP